MQFYISEVFGALFSPLPATVSQPSAHSIRLGPWRIFTKYKGNSSTAADFNVSGAFANGWKFYYTAIGSGATDFYPASGFRVSINGTLVAVGLNGYYWNSAPEWSTSTKAGNMDFNGSVVNPDYGGARAFGLAVRCVQE